MVTFPEAFISLLTRDLVVYMGVNTVNTCSLVMYMDDSALLCTWMLTLLTSPAWLILSARSVSLCTLLLTLLTRSLIIYMDANNDEKLSGCVHGYQH